MGIRKHKLEYTEDFNFLLLGLVSSENDYRLIWTVNQQLGFAFEKTGNHKVPGRSGQMELEFSHYIYENEDLFLLYRIIANKSEEGVLLEELKNIDYLMVVQGEFTDLYIKDLISGLKSMEHIQAVFRINPTSLKNRERLLIL